MRQRGYSLSMLFLLIAFCSVMAAWLGLVIQAVRVDSDKGLAAAAGVSLGLGLAILGGLMGAYQFRRGVGVGIGSLLGLLLGALAGTSVVMSEQQLLPAVAIGVGGSGMMLFVAGLIRFASSTEPAEISPFATGPWDGDEPDELANPPQPRSIVNAEIVSESSLHEDSRDSSSPTDRRDG
ncbi:MAG: hypothetical protein R3C99_06475 [Pirellulaceae bacterium]